MVVGAEKTADGTDIPGLLPTRDGAAGAAVEIDEGYRMWKGDLKYLALGYGVVRSHSAPEPASKKSRGAVRYLCFVSLAINVVFLTKLAFARWPVDDAPRHLLDQSHVTPQRHIMNPTLNPDIAALSSIVKRQAQTGCGSGRSMEDYNTALHVWALFIVLLVSGTACAFPMIVIKFPNLRIPSSFLFLARHFGTGVLLATAFVHLLPTAFLSLTDPCLPAFWTKSYPALSGAIALGSVFLVTVVEMIFSPGQRLCPGSSQQRAASDEANSDADVAVATVPNDSAGGEESATPRDDLEAARQPCRSPIEAMNIGLIRDFGPLCGRSSSSGRVLTRMDDESARLDQVEAEMQRHSQREKEEKENHGESSLKEGVPLTPEQHQKKAVLQCMLLEMGILFHSVFIGMAMSVSVGKEFVVLWIAISFHRESNRLPAFPGARRAG